MDEIRIATKGFRKVHLRREQAERLRLAIEEAIHHPFAEPAPFRIAPDLRFSIGLAEGERIFELLAGGTVLPDPVAGRVWQLPGVAHSSRFSGLFEAAPFRMPDGEAMTRILFPFLMCPCKSLKTKRIQ